MDFQLHVTKKKISYVCNRCWSDSKHLKNILPLYSKLLSEKTSATDKLPLYEERLGKDFLGNPVQGPRTAWLLASCSEDGCAHGTQLSQGLMGSTQGRAAKAQPKLSS